MSGRHGALFADKTRTRSSSELMRVLWRYLARFKIEVFLVAVLTLFYTAAITYQPIVVKNAIDDQIDSASSSTLLMLVGIYITLSLLAWFTQSLTTWVMAKIQNELVHHLRSDTFEKLVEADFSYHSQIQSGNITSRVVNDTQEITTGLNVFTTSATNILVAVSTLIVLFSISIWFGLISLIAIPTAMMITSIISSKGKARMLKVRSSMGRVSGKLAENLAGVSIAKSFNQEDRTSEEIRNLNNETFENYKSLGAMMVMIFPSITMISMVMISLVVISGGYLYENTLITIGAIYLGTVMVRRFLSPILALSNNITNLQASLAALDRVVDILYTHPSVGNAVDAKDLEFKGGSMKLDNVSFTYAKRQVQSKGMGNDGHIKSSNDSTNSQVKSMGAKTGMKSPSPSNGKPANVLTNVSFEIPAGKKTALIGHTGAGKSTITKLLLRFYDPSNGQITIDGQDLREITLESLYDTVSLVSQEPYLFVGSVTDNIRYGRPDASDEEVRRIASLVGADEFIDALPDGYETQLSESGKSLSAGQRQMITIARVMLKDPKILILDEATSRLDAYTESLVQEAQIKLFSGRTTLVIAHRLSTVRDVDQIVVMDDGRAVEIGTHEELMKLNGKYTELYNLYYAHQGLEMLAAD